MREASFLALGSLPAGSAPEDWLCAGPFCFAGQENRFPDWERRFRFAPEPLAEPEKLAQAARIAQALCVDVIPEIARKLAPGISNTFSPVYWNVLLSPWCIDMARQMVERSIRCEAMVRAWGHLPLKVTLLPEACEFDFRDEHDFTLRGNLGESFNHWLLSRILENMWPGNWQKEYRKPERHEFEPAPGSGLDRAREAARRYLLRLPFPRLKGMSLAQAVLYSGALRHPLKNTGDAVDPARAFANPELLKTVRLPENYTRIFEKSLPLSIRRLKHVKRGSNRANKPYLRIASPVAYEDSVYRQNLAAWRDAGNCLAFVQHGGNYGQVRTSCEAEIVEYSQNFFFTWGWKSYENVRGNFIPMPYPQLAKLANAWTGEKKGIIFTGTEMAAYGYRLDSHPTPLQFVEYRRWKADFLNRLPLDIRKQIWYRPYFKVPGTLADADWLLPRFPEVNLCRGSLTPQILACGLLVLDHHGTTLLEAMAANVPMLLFWNRKHWRLCDSCEKLIDRLEECGVWHPTPESAAKKIMEIWPDTGAWWQSGEIVEARKIFCQNQAQLPAGDLNSKWVRVLRNL